MTTKARAKVIHANAFDAFTQLNDNSVDLIVTDPPYFIDGMGDDWDATKLESRAANAGVVGSLPTGMKFEPEQGKNFQDFMHRIALEAYRVLKPGGFFISFSQARLYHRLGVAVEDAGFEMRDMLAWKYEGQAKAFSQSHFLRRQVKSGKLTQAEADDIDKQLGGRKTPQLKPQLEPMTLAQKPREGTFINNWLEHRTGLVDTTQSLDGKFPGNVMEVPKPRKEEKGKGNEHLTVKPITLIEHLIKLFSVEGQLVLDPFTGSGSHGVAAVNAGRRFLGFEIERKYAETSARRLRSAMRRKA